MSIPLAKGREGSRVTADAYLRGLCSSVRRRKLPIIMFEQVKANGTRSYNFLIDLVSGLERKGKTGSQVPSKFKGIKF
jgi:hypothetical protein